MLAWRLFLGPILIALLALIFYFDARAGVRAPYLWGMCVLLALRSSWEMIQLLRTRSFQPQGLLVMLCSAAVVSANWFWPHAADVPSTAASIAGLGPAMLTYALCSTLFFVSGAMRYASPGTSMETLGAELLTLTYIAVFTSLTAQLRWVAGDTYLALGSLVMVTKCGDTMAYTFGHLFGRKKLAPLLSPGKTWMGALGAVVGGMLGAAAWFQWGTNVFAPALSPAGWERILVYGLVIAIVGMVGDLCESLIKRDLGKKDSAPLMPGFGGLLDLLDSVIFTGPIAYLLWLAWPPAV